ncbi:hypothetical protein A1O3_05920 [Capronia epimyces CBS 606.96]|uniref:Enoyl reductase (ER) domain-containing protein n=1 Tax=Capronia epimyces CBS 606.96 TaxID=1182542 RepID=W9Y6I4_9EURO|nr:uncharacterized protein A1O3_05920 [Capronia epimyces CBS 606.96]EXJ85245.1 hypothetical protein A1O3_05920 [Capronia epimyces CBS 606.96]
MATQTALALTTVGKPLTLISLPGPESVELKGNEVLIKVSAVGLAPLDQKIRDLGYFNIGDKLPAVLGGDVVGIVVKTGSEVSFPVGALVFSQIQFHRPAGGGLQEYTVVNGLYTAIVPQGISATEAALYPINAVTSALALFSSDGFGFPFPGSAESANFDYASQKIVVIGGGSNTGKLAIQLARVAGVGTIVAVASPSNTAELKGYGATHVVARQDEDIRGQVRAIVGDDLLYVYDTVNFGDYSLAVSLLSDVNQGTVVHLLPGGNVSDAAAAQNKVAGVHDKPIAGFSHKIPEVGRLFWKEFPAWMARGEIKPIKYHVIEGLDADAVNAALDEYKAGRGGDRYHVKL